MRRTKPTHLVTVISGATFLVAVFVGLMFFGGFWTVGKTYDVSVYVPNARGLAPNSTVMIAGLEVGKVTSIERKGPDAILTLRIDDLAPTPLPENSTVAVRLRSLVGESYVQVYPGDSKIKVASGGSLGLDQANDYVDVDQLLQALSGPTQTRARQTVQALGGAVGKEGDHLNHVLGNFAALVSNSLPVTSTLAAQHDQVADLVQNLGNVMNAIGQRTTAVEDFATGARQTFTAIAARDTALHETLDKLPYVMAGLRSFATDLDVITPQVAPMALNLAAALHDVSPAIHLLTPASRSGIKLLHGLSGAAYPLRGVMQKLEQLQKPTSAALPQVHALLCQLNPILKYGAPYGPDAGAFFENFGSVANAYDATGHADELFATVSPDNVAGAFNQSLAAAAEQVLLSAGILHYEQDTGYNAFNKPGDGDNTTIGHGAYGPVSAGKIIKYPHVLAGDC